MKKWRCIVCQYIYDPKIADPENGIYPVRAFEDLPDYWGCPECGAAPDMFEPVEDRYFEQQRDSDAR